MLSDTFDYQPPNGSWPRLIYQDKDVLVIKKPSGLLSNPGKGPALADSVQHRLEQQFSGLYLVHRLDLATSGLMVFALRRKAEAALKAQFANRQVDKTYLALVTGKPNSDTGRIDAPLSADLARPPRNKVCEINGKAALTYYQVLWSDGKRSLLQLKPITGRSHQLRVHLLSIGHPILGDALYGEAASQQACDRLLLHACSLAFNQPYSGERLQFDWVPDWSAYGVPSPIQLKPWHIEDLPA